MRTFTQIAVRPLRVNRTERLDGRLCSKLTVFQGNPKNIFGQITTPVRQTKTRLRFRISTR